MRRNQEQVVTPVRPQQSADRIIVLDKGTVVNGCLQCPWHGARYRIEDGHVVRGPSLYDQPAYEIQAAEGGGYEVRRIAS